MLHCSYYPILQGWEIVKEVVLWQALDVMQCNVAGLAGYQGFDGRSNLSKMNPTVTYSFQFAYCWKRREELAC